MITDKPIFGCCRSPATVPPGKRLTRALPAGSLQAESSCTVKSRSGGLESYKRLSDRALMRFKRFPLQLAGIREEAMLTETLAAAYFQAMIMILIFLLGVPAFLLQIIAPTVDLHRLVQRRFKISIQAYVVLLLAIGITIFFSWSMHPSRDGLAGPTLLFANGLMSCVILLAGGAWAYYFHRFTRTGVILRIKRAISKSHQRQGIAHEEAERNLGFLGETSRAGREKQQILAVFRDLCLEIIEHKKYDGTRLLLLVEGVKRTLLTPGHFGSERNFRDGARLLQETRTLIREHRSHDLSLASDLRWIDETIAALAITAASEGFKVCHELLAQLKSEKLLEVGVIAWRTGEVTIYTNAVGKLRSKYLDARTYEEDSREPEEDSREVAISLLALLAHIALGGSAAKRWSEERLALLRDGLGDAEFQREIKRSCEERFCVGDFESADALTALSDRFFLAQNTNHSSSNIV